jgi:hypothetical protein
VVPSGAVLACHPCYPGGPPVTWQRCWSLGHRSSSPDNGVDALAELKGLHLGSLHATACEVARARPDATFRELGVLGYPAHLPQATRARCPLPEPDFHRQVPEYPRHTVRYLCYRLKCSRETKQPFRHPGQTPPRSGTPPLRSRRQSRCRVSVALYTVRAYLVYRKSRAHVSRAGTWAMRLHKYR